MYCCTPAMFVYDIKVSIRDYAEDLDDNVVLKVEARHLVFD